LAADGSAAIAIAKAQGRRRGAASVPALPILRRHDQLPAARRCSGIERLGCRSNRCYRSRAVASAVNSISSFLPGRGRKTPPGAHSDFTILRRVLGMALRYRRGMAMAAGTTVVAALIQLLDPTVSREGRRYGARPPGRRRRQARRRQDHPGFADILLHNRPEHSERHGHIAIWSNFMVPIQPTAQ
jgi:hypothetical protein